jgi:hypothetical protein
MHEEPQIQISAPPGPERGQFNFAFFVAAAAAVILLAAFYLWPGRQSPSRGNAEVRLPFGPAERTYAARVQFQNLALRRAENFLKQEVYTLAGEAVNAGDRAIVEMEITAEFVDELGQIALRESRLAVNSASPPLDPGQRRAFDVSFEHIPASWNGQLPAVRVTGLRLAPPVL